MKKENLYPDRIPIIRITFKGMPDLILEKEEYHRYGNLMRFCSEYSINLKDIKRVHSEMINCRDFPTTAWEG